MSATSPPFSSISLEKPLDEAESPLLEAESLRARSAAARELGERADRVRWSASMTARAPSAWRRPRSTCQSGTSTRKASVAVRRSMGSGSAQPSFVAILPAIVGCGLRRGIVLRSGHAQAAQRTIDISFLQHTWPCSMWWPCGMPFAKELDECATDSSRLSGILCSYRSYWKPRRALRPSGCNISGRDMALHRTVLAGSHRLTVHQNREGVVTLNVYQSYCKRLPDSESDLGRP